MKARRNERPVRSGHAGEPEPSDPLNGEAGPVTEPWPSDTVPVRHLAHRMLEALS